MALSDRRPALPAPARRGRAGCWPSTRRSFRWSRTPSNHYLLADFDAGLAAAARVEALGEATGDPRLQSFGAYTAGLVLAMRGDRARGIAACRRGVERARDPIATLLAQSRLGRALMEAGGAAAGAFAGQGAPRSSLATAVLTMKLGLRLRLRARRS
jgi:hypothetical protein